jgi:hypothetical protein
VRPIILLVAVLLVLTGCVPADPDEEGAIIIVAMAGPTCAVETDPPDPECAPQPVAAASIVVTPADGSEVVIAEGETDAEGRVTLAMPAGDYVVTAGPVEGLVGPPQPVVVSVLGGVTTELPIAYDTGIR